MVVKEILNISPGAFFDTLVQSALYDINSSLGTEIAEAEIAPGFSYEKKMKNKLGQQGNVHVTIVQFCRPQQYEVQFQSAQGTNTIAYHIRELDPQRIEVDYQEGFEGKKVSGSLNYRLLSGLYQRSAKKRMAKMLHSMEAFIQNKEKGQAT